MAETNGGGDGDGQEGGDFLSVADDTGTVHVMVIPDHLRGQTNEDLVREAVILSCMYVVLDTSVV